MSYYDNFKNNKSLNVDMRSIGMIDSNERSIDDMINKWTGSGLTSAQIEQNNFNAYQAWLNRDWQERMSNTAYQRQVKDMQAAGVNPALMYGSGASGASTPSGATATAGSNDNGLSFQELISSLMLPMQMAQTAANISNIKANTGKTIAETEGFKLENEWRDKTMDARVESAKLANGLTAEQIENVKSSRHLVDENIKKTIAETSNEFERKFLIQAETRLQSASAEQIVALLPYNKLLLEAQTESQKMTALASAVHAMYEKRMLDAGYIENMIESAKKQASAAMTSAAASYKMAKVNAALADFKRSIFEGDLFDPSEHGAVGSVVAKGLNGLLQAMSGLATALGGPLSGLLQ